MTTPNYFLVLECCFWGAAAIIVYTYAVYPVLALIHGNLFHRPLVKGEVGNTQVSLIIAAHNEQDSIAAKLENVLCLTYPRDQLEILIASDGSTDRTNQIVQQYQSRGVRLLALPRRGKASALNAAVAASSGEILVFSDANSMYAPDAIENMVKHFFDPRVGGVAGNQVYLPDGARKATLTADGERLYWGLDRWMKKNQSRAGNVISATGAIYSIRRSLFRPVPEGVTDDFVTSTRVIAQGYRLVFEPEAIAFEPVAKSSEVEFGRKVRVMTRGFCGVLAVRELLNPFRYGMYSIQLFSHKVLRRIVSVPLIVLLLISPMLWNQGLVYQAATIAQLTLYGLALIGMFLKGSRAARTKIFTIPSYFCLVNVAALVAAINVIRGNRILLWEPQRSEEAPVGFRPTVAEHSGV
jgi:cellulose synthase/poly-beta-1,6-N-acetylglucosamine synthase-like glycosyltransferase